MQSTEHAPIGARAQAQAQAQAQTQSAQTTQKSSKLYACVSCQQRKIKCDRNEPCSNCSKSKADCKFVAPAPRRRKRKSPEEELLLRVQQCELLLKKHGIDVDSPDKASIDHSGDSSVDEDRERMTDRKKEGAQAIEEQPVTLKSGRLIHEEGGTRYVEETLWNTVSDEISYGNIAGRTSESSDSNSWGVYPDGGSLLFGIMPPKFNLNTMHPTTEQQTYLWAAFQENVNSMFKLLHVPTTQKQIFEAVANTNSIPKRLNALIFAVNNAAIGSMKNEDCLKIMGEPKSKVFPTYMAATQHALIQAGLLQTSDLVVLQAFVLFLLIAQTIYDPHSLGILTGVAMRIAQRIGIHRDGMSLGLSIFETEIRRRLWWQVHILEGQASRLTGGGYSIELSSCDKKLPLNVDDADLSPNMTKVPVQSPGRCTEMLICMIRCEMCKFMTGQKDKICRKGGWQNFSSDDGYTTEECDAAVQVFESRLQNDYLKYCDPLVPIQFLAIVISRASICKIKVIQHHPRLRPNIAPEKLDMVLTNTINIIGYTNLVHSTKSLRKYFWHVRAASFQSETFIFLVNELRTCTTGEIADRAWVQIQEVLEYCAEIITDTRNPLFVAMRNLIIKAWDARVKAVGPSLETPEFMTMLRAVQRSENQEKKKKKKKKTESEAEQQQIQSLGLRNPEKGAAATSGVPPSSMVEMSPLDWSYWDDLLHEFDIPFDVMNGTSNPLGGL